MGIFDSIKEANEQRKIKVEKLKNKRGKLLAFQMVDYIGGYEDYTKSSGVLFFYENQAEYKASLKPNESFIIPTSSITDIALEGKDDVNRRVTVTRLLLVGIFAFALKKKANDKESYVVIVENDSKEAIFHIKNQSPIETRAKISKAVQNVKQGHKTEK